MGFDLSGKKPKTTNGEYFRNNVWWWRPLWNYVVENCGSILSVDDAQAGEYNDGYLITGAKAIKIADKLDTLVKSKETKKYEKEYMSKLKKAADVPCTICSGTGERHDEIVDGKCNSCKGTGKMRPFYTSYPFSTENVKEFAKFARESGGFQIY